MDETEGIEKKKKKMKGLKWSGHSHLSLRNSPAKTEVFQKKKRKKTKIPVVYSKVQVRQSD